MRRVASAVAATFVFAACSVWSVASTAAPACAAGATRVAVIVDFKGARDVSASCVPVASGGRGSDALYARADMLGTPAPQFNKVGLLCQLDGYPEHGCDGTVSASRYWSYWLGEGSWTYSSYGPGFRRASGDTVEGWRFQDGVSSENDAVPPRGSPVASDTCTVDAPPPSTATTPAPPGADPTPAPAGQNGTAAPATTTTPSAPGSSESETTSTTSTSAPPGSSTSSDAVLAAGAPPTVGVSSRAASSGSTSWLFGGSSVAVAAVIGAGVWQARRRRTDSP